MSAPSTSRPGIDILEGRVISADAGGVVLAIPGTAYRLHLVPHAATASHRLAIGSRIAGTIHAQALRMHRARAGGRFIEPVDGHPRIVQGAVRSIDPEYHRVLLDVGVPVWVSPTVGPSVAEFVVGELLNCYVRSGAVFQPA